MNTFRRLGERRHSRCSCDFNTGPWSDDSMKWHVVLRTENSYCLKKSGKLKHLYFTNERTGS